MKKTLIWTEGVVHFTSVIRLVYQSVSFIFSHLFSDTLEDKWKFNYDTVWGGLFLRATDGDLDFGVDYGFPYYNDHHFHLGYFLYALAYYVQHHQNWGLGQ